MLLANRLWCGCELLLISAFSYGDTFLMVEGGYSAGHPFGISMHKGNFDSPSIGA
ncbi:hypothetical protein [Mechercharimyces sp. CAU 1602]|uniref:hypothetical protein n=1 Tax=Mechercharimyces sp. CAU 1602 TaxID=2973933 RepID=UPI002163C176|nr:hypothetical protein [Mechercharimyces sp. CAU 1602]MCS1351328.1 hypothetical protein [Mechercharimyces sp. CAU 1602]